MNNIAKRLLTFFIGLPLVIALVFIQYQNHLVLNFAIVLASVIGANEFLNIISSKVKITTRISILTFSGLIPILGYVFILANISLDALLWIFTIEVILILAEECFKASDFTFSFEKIAFSSFIVFYCGYMLSFITRLTSYENSNSLLVLFFLFVFMCDSGAWFFGMLLGKNNRGIFKASPNKSLAGFIGGIITDVAIAILLKFVFPEIYQGDLWKYIVLGFVTAIGAICGDLIESVFKRSCGVKDSGNLIPGRGGILDCIDSIIIAIPVFFIMYEYLLVY